MVMMLMLTAVASTMMMMMMMLLMIVHTQNINIRIIHSIAIHPGHLAPIRKNAVQLSSTRGWLPVLFCCSKFVRGKVLARGKVVLNKSKEG